MSSVSCNCPNCHHAYKVSYEMLGRTARCKECRAEFTLSTDQRGVETATRAESPTPDPTRAGPLRIMGTRVVLLAGLFALFAGWRPFNLIYHGHGKEILIGAALGVLVFAGAAGLLARKRWALIGVRAVFLLLLASALWTLTQVCLSVIEGHAIVGPRGTRLSAFSIGLFAAFVAALYALAIYLCGTSKMRRLFGLDCPQCGARDVQRVGSEVRQRACGECGSEWIVPPALPTPRKAVRNPHVPTSTIVVGSASGPAAKSAHADPAGQPRRCPACGAAIETAAVICVACGYDFRTARRVATAGEHRAATEPPAPDTADAKPRLDVEDGKLSFDCACGARLTSSAMEIAEPVTCPQCATACNVPLPHESTLSRGAWLELLRGMENDEARACVDQVAEREVQHACDQFEKGFIDGKSFDGTVDDARAARRSSAVRMAIVIPLFIAFVAAWWRLMNLGAGLMGVMLLGAVSGAVGKWGEQEMNRQTFLGRVIKLRMLTKSGRRELLAKPARKRADTDFLERRALRWY